MKATTKGSIVLATVFSMFAASADAATLFLQAGSGHPHLTAGTAKWSDEWSGSPGTAEWFEILDGRSIQLSVPSVGNTIIRSWDTPIPLTSTNVNWTAVARASNVGAPADFSNRICSFTSTGVFSNCGAPVAAGAASVVLVPLEGSAYSQSVIVSKCLGGGFCGVASTLFAIKASG